MVLQYRYPGDDFIAFNSEEITYEHIIIDELSGSENAMLEIKMQAEGLELERRCSSDCASDTSCFRCSSRYQQTYWSSAL